MNYMTEVAKMFGVELGERFNIVDNRSSATCKSDYYFSDFGLMVEHEEHSAFANKDLIELLKGGYTIKRKPWKPKDTEYFYSVTPGGGVFGERWSEGGWDHSNLYKLGNCYKTRGEAEANKDKWVNFYASDEILGI